MSCYDNYMDFFFLFCVCFLVGVCVLDFLVCDSQMIDLCVIDFMCLWFNQCGFVEGGLKSGKFCLIMYVFVEYVVLNRWKYIIYF